MNFIGMHTPFKGVVQDGICRERAITYRGAIITGNPAPKRPILLAAQAADG